MIVDLAEADVGVLDQIPAQLAALAAFFAFPAFQYVLLKIVIRRKGRPELWYLPEFGFRLVVRNLPYHRTLTDIRYRAFVRTAVPSSAGSSVTTLDDQPILSREDMVLFPGTDQILLSFSLGTRPHTTAPGTVTLRITSKLGAIQQAIDLAPSDRLICDYTAIIHNFLNFDIMTGKRVEIDATSLAFMLAAVWQTDHEREFPVDRTRNIH